MDSRSSPDKSPGSYEPRPLPSPAGFALDRPARADLGKPRLARMAATRAAAIDIVIEFIQALGGPRLVDQPEP